MTQIGAIAMDEQRSEPFRPVRLETSPGNDPARSVPSAARLLSNTVHHCQRLRAHLARYGHDACVAGSLTIVCVRSHVDRAIVPCDNMVSVRGNEWLGVSNMPRGATLTQQLAVVLTGAMLLTVTACNDGAFNWSFLFPERIDTPADEGGYTDPMDNSAAYRDTVAELAYFDGLRRLRIRGFGIVVGLGQNGSRRCPKSIRSQLIQELYKTRDFSGNDGTRGTPEDLIDDIATAVVAVEAEIPAASARGSRFDLVVRAVPGTETTSLGGGWLLPCNLTIFSSRGGSGWIPGRQVASGGGPVFMNPFGQTGERATKTNRREGTVIGGGVSEQDRRIRLMLTAPSYHRAMAISQRINERFAGSTQIVADAVSPAEIRVVIPDANKHDPRHFLALAQHLYLPLTRPGFISERRRQLAREFAQPDSPHVEIALAWEAIGRTALPDVQKFYDHELPACSFHAAIAGLRLGDDDAIRIIERHLTNPRGRYRDAAIHVLATARHSLGASRPLRRALSDSDPRIRIAAYEALLERDDPTIRMKTIGAGAFSLDRLKSGGKNLIYAKRSKDRRIAVFGDAVRLQPPLFFNLPNDTLMIDAADGAEKAVLLRKSPVSGATSPRVTSDLNIEAVIALMGDDPPKARDEPVRGLGVDFSSIVLAISDLCDDGSINAQFVLESSAMSGRSGMSKLPGRPESEPNLGTAGSP